VIESVRLLEGLPKTAPVFDVAGVTADARIENVFQSVLPEEQVADHPQTGTLLPCPQRPQLSDRVYRTLQLTQLSHQTIIAQSVPTHQWGQLGTAVLHKGYYPLPEVLRDVLRLVARLIYLLTLTGKLGPGLLRLLQGQERLRVLAFEVGEGRRVRVQIGVVEEGVHLGMAGRVILEFSQLGKVSLLGVGVVGEVEVAILALHQKVLEIKHGA
jgi:hypothetical protein